MTKAQKSNKNVKGLLGVASKLMTKNLTNHNGFNIESHGEDEYANLWDTK